ncbi:chorismate mutase [Allocatelliglobosispora scoriae]|uniref:Chorismate mutase n=1 Tax=Allocatelliglobosispora scoriae TaxID=643052 RepID=A0A841C1J8_9ACTN|nr:chorismate mutase [Allocatelliglobosispora scoriae]MBB5873628.1 chorismate mutase [Allocatelliglobosispora scoriae]
MASETVAEPELVTSLQGRLDRIDLQLIRLIRERLELAQQVQQARVACGRSGFAHDHELATARRFSQLGPHGSELAVILLRHSR